MNANVRDDLQRRAREIKEQARRRLPVSPRRGHVVQDNPRAHVPPGPGQPEAGRRGPAYVGSHRASGVRFAENLTAAGVVLAGTVLVARPGLTGTAFVGLLILAGAALTTAAAIVTWQHFHIRKRPRCR